MTEEFKELMKVPIPPKTKTEGELFDSNPSEVQKEMVKEEASNHYPADEEESKKCPSKEEGNIEYHGKTLNMKNKCPDCDKVFCAKTTLNMHIRTVHLKELRFSCGECDYKTNFKKSLDIHNRGHTGEKPFVCSDCGKMCKTSSSLSLHIRTIHLKQIRFACEVCDYKTNDKTSMEWHEAKHIGAKKPNECGKCGEVYNDKTLLSNHMVTAHKYKCCEICGKSFLRQLSLRRHQLKHSTEQRSKKCPDDVMQNDVIKPQKIYTPEFKIDAVKKVQEVGLTKASRELNLNGKTLQKWRNIILRPLQCSVCGKEFSNNWDLKIHAQHQHPEVDDKPKKTFKKKKREHQCDKCSQLFTKNATLRCHMTTCTGYEENKEKAAEPSSIICNICWKTFKENRRLEEHIRCVHQKIKNIFCEYCSQCFGRRRNLISHIKNVHDTIRNFSCEYCEKKFAMISQKKRHERKHTGEKPYRCENCGESCSKYRAKKAEYQCIHCNAALVPVVFKQVNKPVEPKNKDDEKLKNPKVTAKERINTPVKKTQFTNSTLRELYRNKYATDGEDILEDGESIKIINEDLVKNEMEDSNNEVCQTVKKSEGKEIIYDEHNKFFQNEEINAEYNFVEDIDSESSHDVETIGDVDDHLVQNEEIEMNAEYNFVEDTDLDSSEREIIDNNHLPEEMKESEGEEMTDDDHNHLVQNEEMNAEYNFVKDIDLELSHDVETIGDVDDHLGEMNPEHNFFQDTASNTEMIENNHLPEKMKKSDFRGNNYKDHVDEHTIISNQDIKSEIEEIKSNIIKNEMESSDMKATFFTNEVKSEHFDEAEKMIDKYTSRELNLEENQTCKICHKIFLTQRNKEEHFKWVHRKEKNLCCEFCSNMFSKQNHLTEHIKAVHEKIRNYSCDFCDKTFAKESSKKIHLKIHTGERPYLCQNCGHWFNQKSEMTEHRSRHLEVKEFQCVECFKPFISRESLFNHVYKNHRVFTEYPCSICGKQFKQKNNLQRHEEYHLGIRDVDTENQEIFTCTKCEKVFKYQNNLTTHMKLHSEGKVQCFVCGKHYTTARGLKEHVTLKHERISKFKCQKCGKAFAKDKDLEVHNSTHLKPIQCDLCSQGYKCQTSLMKHREKEHPHCNSR